MPSSKTVTRRCAQLLEALAVPATAASADDARKAVAPFTCLRKCTKTLTCRDGKGREGKGASCLDPGACRAARVETHMLMYVLWNRAIERIADYRVALESLDFADLCTKAGAALRASLAVDSSMDVSSAWSATWCLRASTATAIAEAANNTIDKKTHKTASNKEDLTWRELKDSNAELADEVWKVASDYAYGRDPPALAPQPAPQPAYVYDRDPPAPASQPAYAYGRDPPALAPQPVPQPAYVYDRDPPAPAPPPKPPQPKNATAKACRWCESSSLEALQTELIEDAIAWSPGPENRSEAVAGFRVGLFTVIVNVTNYNVGHKGHGAHMALHVVRDALQLACSLNEVGSRLPRHVITAFLSPQSSELLLRGGYDVLHDETRRSEQMKRVFHLFAGQGSKNRNDGWATYFKFLLWDHVEYDRILFLDADVTVHFAPERWLSGYLRLVRWTTLFCSQNTHLMLLRPQNGTSDQMIEKARTCDYKNWTNTEQEIIVAYFPENGRALKHKIVAPDPIDSLPKIGVDVPAGRMCAGLAHCHATLAPCTKHRADTARMIRIADAPRDTEGYYEAYRIAVEILKGSLPKGEVPIPDAKCLEASKSQLRASNIPRNIVAHVTR